MSSFSHCRKILVMMYCIIFITPMHGQLGQMLRNFTWYIITENYHIKFVEKKKNTHLPIYFHRSNHRLVSSAENSK